MENWKLTALTAIASLRSALDAEERDDEGIIKYLLKAKDSIDTTLEQKRNHVSK